jgi:hypothetical protein
MRSAAAGLSKAMYRQMLRRSASARRETNSSAAPTLATFEGRSLFREHMLHVEAAGATARLTFVPAIPKHGNVTFDQVPARLP